MNLENEILKFIDEKTWDKDLPKVEIRPTKGGRRQITPHRIKIRWMNIRWKKGYPERKEKRFVKSDIKFNKALNNLKRKKLITSRTKCQLLAGLTTTKLGHNTLKNFIPSN